MNDQTQNPPPGDDPLQFEQAEYANPAASQSCVVCKQPISDSYYQVNDKSICPNCREQIEKTWTGGSGMGRFVRSTVFGVAAAALGAGIWYAISVWRNAEYGIIAIAVGFMVGWAVRRGANSRGGWVYQTLAIFLTYTAIVSTYVPPMWKGIREATTDARQSSVVSTNALATTAAPDETAATTTEQKIDASERRGRSGPTSFAGWIVTGVVLFAFAFVTPFFAGFENFIGWIIIAIALYEAWKLNKRAALQITGPYQVGSNPLPPVA